jgi:hypothetical protein
MTKVKFKYDFDKDVSNFIAGTRAKNSSKPTKFQRSYIDIYGEDYDEEKVRDFLMSYIQESGFEALKYISVIDEDWQKIEEQFFARVEKMFGITYPATEITAYLTTNQRCTYNISENYFFAYFDSKFPNRTIMHELFHFYTWYAFDDDLIKAGKNSSEYNDIKESLTELLNIEFSDLMEGAHDDGYPQHIEMREKIRSLWQKEKDLRKVISSLQS